MMDGTLVKELSAIQADIVNMEGMIEALIRGAYSGTKTEYIGNLLEILREYIGRRAEKLDMLIQEPAEGGGDIGRA